MSDSHPHFPATKLRTDSGHPFLVGKKFRRLKRVPVPLPPDPPGKSRRGVSGFCQGCPDLLKQDFPVKIRSTSSRLKRFYYGGDR